MILTVNVVSVFFGQSGQSNPSNVYSNGFNGSRDLNITSVQSENKVTAITAKSSYSRKSVDGKDIPAVVSSTADDLVNLDDLRSAIIKNNVQMVEKILSFGEW
jgi:hypothetical protein